MAAEEHQKLFVVCQSLKKSHREEQKRVEKGKAEIDEVNQRLAAAVELAEVDKQAIRRQRDEIGSYLGCWDWASF